MDWGSKILDGSTEGTGVALVLIFILMLFALVPVFSRIGGHR